MTLAKKSLSAAPSAPPKKARSAPLLVEDGEAAMAHPSQALAYQAMLEEHFAEVEPPKRWSRPTRAAIILGGGALAWAGAILAVSAAMGAFA